MIAYVEHRGVKARLTDTGHWVFDEWAPLPWAYWCRFFTAEEHRSLRNPSELSITAQEDIIKRAIDRALDGCSVFMGDLRDQ